MTQQESHPIPDKDLDSYKSSAEKHLKSIKGKFDIEEIFRDMSPQESYRTLPEEMRLTLAVRRGTCHFFYFVNLLLDRTGQKQEVQKQRELGLATATLSILEKTKFCSAYAFFVMASSICASCSHFLRNLDQSKLAHIDPQEFELVMGKGFNNDLSYMFSYYADALNQAKTSGLIQEAGDTISVTRDFWQMVAKKAVQKAKEIPELLKLVESTTFHNGPFVIRGLVAEDRKEAKVVVWSPVEPNEVVGDQDVTIIMVRNCDRLALYDPSLRKNPVSEFGGVLESFLIDGPPGTGKTTRQRMMMTRLAKRAEQIGLPFVFKSITADQVKSEWYGKSASLIKTFLDEVTNPAVLSLFFADDIDLLIQGDRNSVNVSGGDLDILKALMDFFSGTGTNFIGNYASVAATNKPTGTEEALRQRFVYRAVVNGPQTWEDYADLAALELRKFAKTGLLKISDGRYKPLQRPLPSKIKDIYKPELLKKHQNRNGSFEDIGRFCEELRKKDPKFTGRPVKNAIQVAVARAADFEVPEEWFTKPELFRTRSWEERLEAVKCLYQVLTVSDILMALEYQFDAERRYQVELEEKRVTDLAQEVKIREKALRIGYIQPVSATLKASNGVK